MKEKIRLIVVLFFVLGSSVVSSSDALGYTAKSIFYGIAMGTLVLIGVMSFYDFFKKRKNINRV